jgi:hypothetical protein
MISGLLSASGGFAYILMNASGIELFLCFFNELQRITIALAMTFCLLPIRQQTCLCKSVCVRG